VAKASKLERAARGLQLGQGALQIVAEARDALGLVERRASVDAANDGGAVLADLGRSARGSTRRSSSSTSDWAMARSLPSR